MRTTRASGRRARRIGGAALVACVIAALASRGRADDGDVVVDDDQRLIGWLGEVARPPAPDVAEESDDDLALDPADASDYEEDDDDEPVLHQSAHVSLVASQLGCSADAEDLGYVVEEEDD